MNVLIIEDENLTAKRLEGMLTKYDPAIRVLAQLPSVADTVAWLSQPDAPALDLVFMDIHLEDDIGFRIFEQTNLQTPVIFTTAYDEYMVQAFKVNSIDYLLKPINYTELVAAIEKFKALKEQFNSGSTPARNPDLDTLLQLLGPARQTAHKDRFMITVGTKIRSIDTTDIAYFYLEERIVFLVTPDNLTLPVDYSLDKLAQLLDPRRFFRVSRQFMVSLPAIQTIYQFSAGKLKLDLLLPRPHTERNAAQVFVSGDRMTDFKEWLGK